jgi:2-dehydro-3-deoxy-D-gluconate 5-dehydrogenase
MTTPPSGPAKLDGRVAIVTGAGRGIGQATAVALAEAGADIAAFDLEAPYDTRAQVEARSRRCLALTVDVADRGAVEAALVRTLGVLDRLDVVVNNAGVAERLTLETMDEATLQRELDVIVKGTILVSQVAYPI